MRRPGGGWKINLLKTALKHYDGNEEKIVLFTDAYDVMFVGQLSEIARRFKATGAKVLFSAEPYCWPNVELAPQYPEVEKGQRLANSRPPTRFKHSKRFTLQVSQLRHLHGVYQANQKLAE